MRKYVLALVLTEETESKNVLSKVKGKIIKTNILGIRPLAYKIKQAAKGWYVVLEIELEEKTIKAVEKLLEADEKVLRHLLVKAD